MFGLSPFVLPRLSHNPTDSILFAVCNSLLHLNDDGSRRRDRITALFDHKTVLLYLLCSKMYSEDVWNM